MNSTDHSVIDMDQQLIEEDDSEFGKVYIQGVHSENSDGTMRTIQSLSTETEFLFRNEGHFELYREYYRRDDYADRFIQSALGGVGEFSGVPKSFRMKSAKLATKVFNLWMYAIHELENAVNYCYGGETYLAVKQWEDSWAIYAGSLEGADGSGKGYLFYDMAEKKCEYFSTCDGMGKSPINMRLIELFNEGRDYIYAGMCENAIDVKIKFVRKFTVPLVQGLLYNLHGVFYYPEEVESYYAKALVFSRGLLPQINHCSAETAKLLDEELKPTSEYQLKYEFNTLVSNVHKQLGCMGVSCEDIGDMSGLPTCKTSGEYKPVPGADQPSKGYPMESMEPESTAESYI